MEAFPGVQVCSKIVVVQLTSTKEKALQYMFYLLLLSLEIMQLPFMHPFYNTFPSKDMVGTCRLRERNCYLK